MLKREQYYKEMVQGFLEKYYRTTIDLSQVSEVLLPNVRSDMLVKISKQKLEKYASHSPLPYLAEENIIELKALNDRLTYQDVMSYIGRLMVRAEDAQRHKKSIALTIFSAEEVPNDFLKASHHPRKATKYEWLAQIEAEYPVYLFVLERLPFEKREYWDFLPFVSLKVLSQFKGEVQQIAKEAEEKAEYQYLLLCLRKLQPEFYKKEVNMILKDNKEVAIDFFPKAAEELKAEGKAEGIIEFLEARFGKSSVDTKIKKQIKAIDSLKKLEKLIKIAALVQNLEEFTEKLS